MKHHYVELHHDSEAYTVHLIQLQAWPAKDIMFSHLSACWPVDLPAGLINNDCRLVGW